MTMAKNIRKIGSVNVNSRGATVIELDQAALRRIKELERELQALLQKNRLLTERCRQAEARLRARELVA